MKYLSFALSLTVLAFPGMVRAQTPNPVLHTVFPAGGQAGQEVTVTVEGAALDGLRDLRGSLPGLTVRKLEGNRFTLAIPAKTPPGVYDLRAVGAHGQSSPRAFFVSARSECLETEPNDSAETAQTVALDSVVNGRIGKPGDVDCFRFEAVAGQRIVIECWAERIDSQLRAVLELCDAQGNRLATNRGHTGIDPMIDFRAAAEGAYLVKLYDLSYQGGSAYFYRLDIDTKPRVEFAIPCVVPQGRATRVKLYGRNLLPPGEGKAKALALDCVEVEVTPPPSASGPVPWPRRPAQVGVDVFPFHYSGGHAPVLIGVSDVPVIVAAADHTVPDRARELTVPCEASGQLLGAEERHWYSVQARRGEVFWLEGFGERIGSPVDLDVTVLDTSGQKELAKFTDSLDDLVGYRFCTAHTDPVGRWVAPADGRYLFLVRNLIGGEERDPRRLYRLSVRREEPDFHLVAVSRQTDQPAGVNLARGGRERIEVIALRRRGLTGPIRVTAVDLPPGVQCPEVWIGPGQDRAALVLSAASDCPAFAGALKLVGRAEVSGSELVRPVQGSTMIWPGRPMPSGRLAQEIPLAIAAEAPFVLTAAAAEAAIDQESIVDVEVALEQRGTAAAGPLTFTAVGLPRLGGNTITTLAPGKSKGWVSVFFPASLPPGPYTFAIQAETAVAAGSKNPGKGSVLLVSNPVTVQVKPARIVLSVDPRNPRKIARGQVIQLQFTAERMQGFIGKVHTELTAPGGVDGLRARGVTFVGQQDTGSLQVIATETAPLGRVLLLRLEAIGTVEDQPVYRACRFVELEITE